MEAFRREDIATYNELKDILAEQAASNQFGDEDDSPEIAQQIEMQRRIEARAGKQAQKLIRKNKRELDRLKKHAGECLISNNKAGYCYAIKKLRDFYRQPYTTELIDQMWNSSRKAALDIAFEHGKKLLKQ